MVKERYAEPSQRHKELVDNPATVMAAGSTLRPPPPRGSMLPESQAFYWLLIDYRR